MDVTVDGFDVVVCLRRAFVDQGGSIHQVSWIPSLHFMIQGTWFWLACLDLLLQVGMPKRSRVRSLSDSRCPARLANRLAADFLCAVRWSGQGCPDGCS